MSIPTHTYVAPQPDVWPHLCTVAGCGYDKDHPAHRADSGWAATLAARAAAGHVEGDPDCMCDACGVQYSDADLHASMREDDTDEAAEMSARTVEAAKPARWLGEALTACLPAEVGPIDKAAILRRPAIDSLLNSGVKRTPEAIHADLIAAELPPYMCETHAELAEWWNDRGAIYKRRADLWRELANAVPAGTPAYVSLAIINASFFCDVKAEQCLDQFCNVRNEAARFDAITATAHATTN